MDESDITDISDDGRPFRRETYTRSRTDTPQTHDLNHYSPVSFSNRSVSVLRNTLTLSDVMHLEFLAQLEADVLSYLPTPRDSLPTTPLSHNDSDSDMFRSLEYVAIYTVINFRNIVRDPIVRGPLSRVFSSLSVKNYRMIIFDSSATKSMFSDSSVLTSYRMRS